MARRSDSNRPIRLGGSATHEPDTRQIRQMHCTVLANHNEQQQEQIERETDRPLRSSERLESIESNSQWKFSTRNMPASHITWFTRDHRAGARASRTTILYLYTSIYIYLRARAPAGYLTLWDVAPAARHPRGRDGRR